MAGRVVAYVALVVSLVSGFNLHEQYLQAVYFSNKNSSFGYSIFFHQHADTTWLLAGAPADGTAHRCDLLGPIACSQLPISSRNGSWLGATVVSRNGNALICSPRTGEFANGDCQYGTGDLRSFTPLFGPNKAQLSYCSLGFSAVLSTAKLFFGAPSCEKNKGFVFWKSYSSITSEASKILAPNASDYDSYFSYAMATVRNGADSEILAASTVFRLSTFGLVRLVDHSGSKANFVGNIEGQQTGEFFGNSLAATDVNGDGLDDLIVGAPHYTDYDDPELKYEIGKVYVYLQNNKPSLFDSAPSRILLGRELGGRFGHSLAALGDINGDGFNDVAIGAPFEGDGKVYIFLGSGNGLRPEPSQVISGGPFGVRTFGFSLAGNVDVDGNGYKDVAVGAYQSDAVVYLPARPVVRMSALSLQFDPAQISLRNRATQCRNEQGAIVSCSTLTYCLNFNGHNVPQTITFNVIIALDVTQIKIPRLFFIKNSKQSISFNQTLSKDQELCGQEKVYIRSDIIKKLQPMEAKMTIQVVNHEPFSAKLPPILNANEPHSTSDLLSIANNCGTDNKCTADLQLQVTMNQSSVVQGAKQYPAVKISVVNRGEDAFESYFNMYLPPSLLFKSSAGMLCSTPEDENGPSLRCNIGNPVDMDSRVDFTVVLEPKLDVDKEDKSIQFNCQVTSTSSEEPATLHDNNVTVSLDLAVSTALTAISRPVELLFNRTLFEVNNQNEATLPRFVQDYEIINSGPSSVLGATVTIYFVTQSREGLDLCSLEAEPKITAGNGTCHKDPVLGGKIAVHCRIDSFYYGKFAVSLSGRLAAGIYQVNLKNNITISSEFTAAVTRLPFGLDPNQVAAASGVAKLLVAEEVKPSLLNSKVEWWVYAASAAGALVLLLIVTLILYKLGFFKRNRPPNSATDTTELQKRNSEQDADEEES